MLRIGAARAAERRAVEQQPNLPSARQWRVARYCVANLLFIDIPNQRTAELARELGELGLQVDGSSFWRGAVAAQVRSFASWPSRRPRLYTLG